MRFLQKAIHFSLAQPTYKLLLTGFGLWLLLQCGSKDKVSETSSLPNYEFAQICKKPAPPESGFSESSSDGSADSDSESAGLALLDDATTAHFNGNCAGCHSANGTASGVISFVEEANVAEISLSDFYRVEAAATDADGDGGTAPRFVYNAVIERLKIHQAVTQGLAQATPIPAATTDPNSLRMPQDENAVIDYTTILGNAAAVPPVPQWRPTTNDSSNLRLLTTTVADIQSGQFSIDLNTEIRDILNINVNTPGDSTCGAAGCHEAGNNGNQPSSNIFNEQFLANNTENATRIMSVIARSLDYQNPDPTHAALFGDGGTVINTLATSITVAQKINDYIILMRQTPHTNGGRDTYGATELTDAASVELTHDDIIPLFQGCNGGNCHPNNAVNFSNLTDLSAPNNNNQATMDMINRILRVTDYPVLEATTPIALQNFENRVMPRGYPTDPTYPPFPADSRDKLLTWAINGFTPGELSVIDDTETLESFDHEAVENEGGSNETGNLDLENCQEGPAHNSDENFARVKHLLDSTTSKACKDKGQFFDYSKKVCLASEPAPFKCEMSEIQFYFRELPGAPTVLSYYEQWGWKPLDCAMYDGKPIVTMYQITAHPKEDGKTDLGLLVKNVTIKIKEKGTAPPEGIQPSTDSAAETDAEEGEEAGDAQ